MTQASSTVPAPHHARVLYLEVHGGYFDGLVIQYAPHVSCIIGGKGSGKTTLFEMLRFGVAATFLIGKENIRSLLKKNLGTGFVRVGYETKHGVRYVIERKLNEDKPRFFTAEGEPVNAPPDVDLLECYGQDEIEKVGEDRASQRKLIDRLSGDAGRAHAAQIARITEQMNEGKRELLALEAEIATLESGAAEARAIEEQLKPLLVGTGEDAAVLVRGHAAKGLRAREKQTLDAAGGAFAEARTKLETLSSSLRAKLQGLVADEIRAGANGALFAEMAGEVAGLVSALEAVTSVAVQRAEAGHAALTELRTQLAVAHATQDTEYDALVARQKEDQAKIDERARLQDRLAVVAGAIPRLEDRVRVHTGLRRAQDALAERLIEAREKRSATRIAVEKAHEETLDHDGVRIRIEADRELEEYKTLLREALGPITGGQPRWIIEKIAPAIRPDELVAIVRAQDIAKLVERASLSKQYVERAAQVIAALTPNSWLYALQSVAIDDQVIIDTKHGKVWKDTVECSPGQRSGAILPLLLLVGDTPLAIDQPDDNIDPAFMCESILPRVVALRGSRQFIFVTHHANVPILSGADQVVLIESNGVSAELRAEGGLVPMKGHMLTGLEGGGNAFERRKQTYEGSPVTPPTAPGTER